MRGSAASLALSLVLAGCVVDPSSPSRTCGGDGDCAPGQRCDRGYCIGTPTPDGGPPDGGGMDAGGNPLCPLEGERCTLMMPGVCRDGTWVCERDEMRCRRDVAPSSETCNGRDDDCDGPIDESTEVACYEHASGCTEQLDGSFTCEGVCQVGVQRCVGGELGECEGDVGPGGSDGCTIAGEDPIDDDCDGAVDDECTCTPDTTQPCYPGPVGTAGVGRCVRGVQTCGADMLWGECTDAVLPQPEACDNPGVDDDCDGMVDDIAGLGDPCVPMGALGVCADGTQVCQDSALVCVGPMMSAMEECDGLDDDCDGNTDEGFVLATDPMNCGSCGNACGMGQSCCEGRCVDTSSDATACGACGRACEGSEVCCRSACVPSDDPSCITCDPACGAGTVCCAGSCSNTLTDPMNCGGCGIACGAGQYCCGGTCVDDSEAHCGGCTPCGAGELCCDSACVPSDEMHCGACETRCAASETCCGGTECANTQADPDHCGTCGMECASGQVCSGGICCPTGMTNCGGMCVNLMNNRDHCGSCGRRCLVTPCSMGGCL